jgi:hypothetical protein
MLATFLPFGWVHGFLQIDVDHIYYDAYFALLFLLGLLAHIPKKNTAAKSIAFGVLVGWLSATLSMLVVELRQRYGMEHLFNVRGGWMSLGFEYIVFPSTILLGSFWGAAAAWLSRIVGRI